MLKAFDGFGAHLLSLKLMVARYENKILALKEEGDSSHVNKAYEKYVAKEDKFSKAESLSMLRSSKQNQQRSCLSMGFFLCWSLRSEGHEAVNLDQIISSLKYGS